LRAVHLGRRSRPAGCEMPRTAPDRRTGPDYHDRTRHIPGQTPAVRLPTPRQWRATFPEPRVRWPGPAAGPALDARPPTAAVRGSRAPASPRDTPRPNVAPGGIEPRERSVL